MGHQCEGCNRVFVNWHAISQHMNAVGHWPCETCTYLFRSEDEADEHMRWVGHWGPRYECEACNDEFMTPQEARRHMELYNHFRNYYCSDCERGFQNENNLRMHLNGSIHRGSSITCPFCKHGFSTATGVTHHLETGSCPKARTLNRQTIYNEIRKRDPNHLITKKLLTYPSSSPTTTHATERCYNGSYYECYLCHHCFGTLMSLNQHVSSPAHEQKVYHCPGRGCVKEFRALAALFNHLESETCGAVRFDAVQRNVGGFLAGSNKLIGFC